MLDQGEQESVHGDQGRREVCHLWVPTAPQSILLLPLQTRIPFRLSSPEGKQVVLTERMSQARRTE